MTYLPKRPTRTIESSADPWESHQIVVKFSRRLADTLIERTLHLLELAQSSMRVLHGRVHPSMLGPISFDADWDARVTQQLAWIERSAKDGSLWSYEPVATRLAEKTRNHLADR